MPRRLTCVGALAAGKLGRIGRGVAVNRIMTIAICPASEVVWMPGWRMNGARMAAVEVAVEAELKIAVSDGLVRFGLGAFVHWMIGYPGLGAELELGAELVHKIVMPNLGFPVLS